MAGRPAIFETPEEADEKVEAYFLQFTSDEYNPQYGEIRPTITGLCLFLGFESRQSFHDYAQKSEFSYTFKKARMRIENHYESMLTNNNAAGTIFALKNLGWDDRTQIKHEGIPETQVTYLVAQKDAAD